MKKFCELIGKYFGVVIILFFIGGMTCPPAFTWVLGKLAGFSLLSMMLGIIMFGMGTTMELKDFRLILQRPRDVFLGAVAQYAIMPFLAYLLSRAFNLDPALTVGVVLVGTCPGGTASNVITFISKGDLALSVTMTTVSTLLSPIMTPLLTYLIIGQRIDFSPVAMFWSIVQIVIIPIGFGVALRHFFPDWCEKAKAYLPALSCLCISAGSVLPVHFPADRRPGGRKPRRNPGFFRYNHGCRSSAQPAGQRPGLCSWPLLRYELEKMRGPFH